MSKVKIYLLTLGLMLLCSVFTYAQPTFNITPTATINANPGDTILYDVTMDDYVNYVAFGHSINWDSTVLKLDTISFFNSTALFGLSWFSHFGTTLHPGNMGVINGEITVIYNHPALIPTTVANNTVIYTIRFIALDNPGASTVVEIAGTPTPLSFTTTSGEGAALAGTSGNVTINGVAPNGLVLTASQESGNTGTPTCVTISAQGFIELIGLQGTLIWDPAILNFDSIGAFNVPELEQQSFNTTAANNGILEMVWFDSDGGGETVANGDDLFKLYFTIVGAGGTSSSIHFTDMPQNLLATDTSQCDGCYMLTTNDGKVDVTGSGGAIETVSFIASTETVDEGTQVCVDFSVNNFDSIIGVTYTMAWDPTILEFDTVLMGANPLSLFYNPQAGGNFGPQGDPGNGIPDSALTFFYIAPNPLTGETLANNTTIYSVCFNVIGSAGQVSPISFTNTPTNISVNDVNSPPELNFDGQDGSVTVTGTFDGITLFTSCPEVNPDSTVCFDFMANNFINITGMTYSLQWDTTIMKFNTIDLGANPTLLFYDPNQQGGNVGIVGDSAITIFWLAQNPVNGQTLVDGTVIFSACFDITGNIGDDGFLNITGTPTAIEIADINSPPAINYQTMGCDYTVEGVGGPLQLVSGTVTDVDCNGESTGAVDISISGGNTPYTYLWNNNETTQDITDLPAGMYSVTVTDNNMATVSDSYTISEPLTGLGATSTETGVSCNGVCDGSIDLTVTGGTSPYNYSWDNGAGTNEDPSGLCAGIYKVTVTDDKGCSLMLADTVTTPSVLSLIIMGADANCNGVCDGTINLTVLGGTSPYSYSWDNGAGTDEDPSGLCPNTYAVTVTDDNACTSVSSVTIGEPTEIILGVTPVDASCGMVCDGSIDLSVMGGTSPYSYSWDNGAGTDEDLSGLCANTYTVTVTDDNGCTKTIAGTVGSGAEVSLNVAPTDASCSGICDGTIDLSVTGGSGMYTYNWNNGAGTNEDPSGLCPNTYSVTVTDQNGCSETITAIVGQGTGFSLGVNPTHVNCNADCDGSIDLTVTAGVMPFTYSWNNGAGTDEDPSGLCAGSYTVTVIDNLGCTEMITATINEPTAISFSTIPTDANCNGDCDGSIDLGVSGGTPPYTYSWDNGAGTNQDPSGLCAGSYSVTITDDNGCEVSTNSTIGEPTAIVINGSATNEMAGGDGAIDITVTGGTPTYNYLWSGGQGTDEDLTGLNAGMYTVTVTDAKGCTEVNSFTVGAASCPSINQIMLTDVSCNGESDGAIDVTITGGIQPYSYLWTGGVTTEDLLGLSAGNYTLTVTGDNGCSIISNTIAIGEPTALDLSISATDVSCNGLCDGTISLSVMGGTSPYNYAWNNGAGTNQNPIGLCADDYTVTVTDNEGCTATTNIMVGKPAVLTVILSEVDASCNGYSDGSISLEIAGGTMPYDYDWSDDNYDGIEDITMLAAGIYSVTITDFNGCDITRNGLINQPSAINIDFTTTNLSCFEECIGAININVTGGTGAYSFAWFNLDINQQINAIEDITNLCAGNYAVTVTDANGCTAASPSIEITEPSEINLSAVVANATSANNDGSVDLTVTGGTTGYTYSWSGPSNFTAMTQDISALALGDYCVTVTDNNGCTANACYQVQIPFDVIETITNVSCFGGDNGSISLQVVGGNPSYEYQWDVQGAISPIITSLMAGDYTVTVTDALGLTITETYTVGQPTGMTLTSINVTNESGQGCNGAINISVAGGTLPYSFGWSHGATSQNVADLCKNTYSVTVIDANGCILISNPIVIAPAPLVIADIMETDVKCNGGDDGEACISTFGGCQPYTFSLGGTNIINSLTGEVCFDELTSGTYTLTITDNGGLTATQDFTIGEPAPITMIIDGVINNTDPTQTNCNGAINISIAGGVTPYNYQWSNGPTSQDVAGLCDNNSPYNVVVTDANGCVFQSSSIEVGLGLVVLFNTTDITCFGETDGAIDIDIFGGTPDYTYSWTGPGFSSTDQNISGLSAGTYAVTITDNGGNSFTNTSLVINAPAAALAITNNVIIPPLVGNDGSIDITVSGGTSPYNYSWNNNETTQDIGGLNGGSYTVVITDAHGCVITGTFIIPSIEPFNVEISVDVAISCNEECDGELSVTPFGGTAPYTYLWNTGDINDKIFLACEGDYSVTVTDANNRVGQVSFALSDPDPIVVEFEADGARRYAKAIPIGGTAPFTYQWNDSGGTVGAELSGVPEGLYAVLITDANACTATGQVDLEDPIDCLESRDIITPNRDGKNDEFIINCSLLYAENSLEVYSRWGQLVYKMTNYDNSWRGKTLSGDDLPEGTYFYVYKYKDSSGANQQVKGHVSLLRR